MKRYSDITTSRPPMTGDKVKIDKILGKEIAVLAYEIKPSTQKENTDYLSLQIELENEKHILFTGSSVLMDQIDECKDNLPFLAKIEKIDKYYTFV